METKQSETKKVADAMRGRDESDIGLDDPYWKIKSATVNRLPYLPNEGDVPPQTPAEQLKTQGPIPPAAEEIPEKKELNPVVPEVLPTDETKIRAERTAAEVSISPVPAPPTENPSPVEDPTLSNLINK